MDGSLFVMLLLSGLFWNSSGLSRQYHYIKTAMSWSEAQSYCREWFTDLATVDSMDDVNRLVNIVDAGYSGSVWIGLKRGTQEHWGWSNGENTTSQYYNWASGQPNGDGDCAAFYSGVWHDMPCGYGFYFVCYGNSGYIMVQSAKTWSDAQSYCRQFYTDLPTIHNFEENDQIKQVLLSGYFIWFGLYLDSWEWSDQWDLRFRHWAANQPSMSTGACVGMSATDSGKWSQQSCDLLQPFICYGDDKRKQIVRLKVTCNGECKLNDPALQTAILNEMSEKLKDMRLESDSTISWRKGEDEEVFHQENNQMVNVNNKCN
ncbi:C-type mannose receptor 2 [Labeo rohita]|uniref:C-type mannose receptor 2 n=1 Tax=Labeo rohita TaxID=84645 RepID=A0ABQ8L2H9_LABRO|nr:C-type mannose receptor 2 [Labeo rohita]